MSINKILVATDLDGTLLKDNKKIGLLTKLYLRKLERKGNVICFSTGRSPRTCMNYQNELGLKGVMVLINGNLIINPFDPDFTMYRALFEKEKLIDIYNFFTTNKNIDGAMCENDHSFYTDNEESFSWTAHEGQERRFCEGSFDKILDDDTYNFVITSSDNSNNNREKIKTFIDKNYPEYEIDFWGNKERLYASLLHKGWNKQTAVEFVRNYYKIKKENTFVFGDSTNDIQMVTSYENGYAMKNSYPELLNVAKKITKKDNNHNGVVFELKKALKSKN